MRIPNHFQRRLALWLLGCLLSAGIGAGAEPTPQTGAEGTDSAAAPQADTSALPPTATPGPSALLGMDGMLFLVNRSKKITKKYEPQDLIKPDVATRKKGMEERILLRREAARALERLFREALKKGHVLYAASGYRSFGIQQLLFNQKVSERGSVDKAQRTVAPAGTSEHQLGLAMDVQCPAELNLNRDFGQTEEGQWVAQNAHRFGFIIRYKKEWTPITGYAYEPWHLRYVGIAHAGAIYRLNIPLESYVEAVQRLPAYVLEGGNDYLLQGLAKVLLDPQASAPAVLPPETVDDTAQALREATEPFLPPDVSYEQALWACYPTPEPTSAPRVETDEETVLFPPAP